MSAAGRQILLLVLFLAAGGSIVVGAVRWTDGNLGPLLVAIGTAGIVGAIVSIRRKGRRLRGDLLADKDVIARWQVSRDELAAFHRIDGERTAVNEEYRNALTIPEAAPAGLPIIVGRNDWLIGARLYRGSPPMGILLCNVAMLEGSSDCIEVAMMTRRSASGWLLALLRLPVPAAARPAAWRVVDHLADRVRPRNRRRLERYFPDYLGSLAGGRSR
jgi:hypothetical protein